MMALYLAPYARSTVEVGTGMLAVMAVFGLTFVALHKIRS
jgi:hypothetical protein